MMRIIPLKRCTCNQRRNHYHHNQISLSHQMPKHIAIEPRPRPIMLSTNQRIHYIYLFCVETRWRNELLFAVHALRISFSTKFHKFKLQTWIDSWKFRFYRIKSYILSPAAEDKTDGNHNITETIFKTVWNHKQTSGPNPGACKGPNEDLLLYVNPIVGNNSELKQCHPFSEPITLPGMVRTPICALVKKDWPKAPMRCCALPVKVSPTARTVIYAKDHSLASPRAVGKSNKWNAIKLQLIADNNNTFHTTETLLNKSMKIPPFEYHVIAFLFVQVKINRIISNFAKQDTCSIEKQ